MITIYGLEVVVEPQYPRYTLPADVPPPPGMTREQFDAWSREVCGYHPQMLKDGQVYKAYNRLHVNAATWEKIKLLAKEQP